MNRACRYLLALAAGACALRASPLLVFIGTGAGGIYSVRFDSADGSLAAPVRAARSPRPGFLASDPDGRRLYAACELDPGLAVRPGAGGVSAFAIDRGTGLLAFLNQRPSGAGAPAHVVVDATGRMVIAADYAGGTICAWPILSDGRLGERSSLVRHSGAPGPNRLRQESPHPHSVTLSPDNRFAVACDLGLDRVFCYRIDPGRASLAAAEPRFAAVPRGLGPRHAKFSSDGRQLYVLNEMGGSICMFGRDPATGALVLRQTVSTLPSGFRGANLSAEIRIDARGRFVYASNRGPDSIAVFSRDPGRGTLSLVQIVPSGGRQPRNFALSPDGRWLLCANRGTNDLTVFSVDPSTGFLAATAHRVAVPQPICVLFPGPG